MDYTLLQQEIAKPEYTGKTDAEILTMLNARTAPAPKPAIFTSAQFLNVCDPGEFAAFRAANPDLFSLVANAAGLIDASQGTATRAIIVEAFQAFPNSLESFQALLATFDQATKPWVPDGLIVPPGTLVTQPDLDRMRAGPIVDGDPDYDGSTVIPYQPAE